MKVTIETGIFCGRDTANVVVSKSVAERSRAGEHDGKCGVPLAICLAALRAVGVPEAEIQEALNG